MGPSRHDDLRRAARPPADLALHVRRAFRLQQAALSLHVEELGDRGVHPPAVGIRRRLVHRPLRNGRYVEQLGDHRRFDGQGYEHALLIHRPAQRLDHAQLGLRTADLRTGPEPEDQQGHQTGGKSQLHPQEQRQHAHVGLQPGFAHVRPDLGLQHQPHLGLPRRVHAGPLYLCQLPGRQRRGQIQHHFGAYLQQPRGPQPLPHAVRGAEQTGS